MLSSSQQNSSNCWCVLQHGHFADARHWKVKAHLPKKSWVLVSLLFKAIHQDLNLPVKYIIYMFSDICSEPKELAIYSVENCLKEISFPWIFTIKKIKKLKTNRKKTIQFFVSEKKKTNIYACNFFVFPTSFFLGDLFLWSEKYSCLPKICHK